MTNWIRHFRSRLLTGLLFILPFFATVWVVNLLFRLVDGVMTEHILKLIPIERELTWAVIWLTRLASLVAVALALYLLGLLATNVVGRRLLRAGDRAIGGIPIVGAVYRATRQMLDAVGGGSSTAFRSCVLIEYPRRELWTMAFVTNETRIESAIAGKSLVSVFVPTTPNPTSGFFLLVPRDECRPLAISVEDGVKMIVSAGIVVPPGFSPADAPTVARITSEADGSGS